MSMRTVVELNHDYVYDLERQGHLSHELALLLVSSERELLDRLNFKRELAGIRFLGRRHHTDDIDVKLGGRVTYTERVKRTAEGKPGDGK